MLWHQQYLNYNLYNIQCIYINSSTNQQSQCKLLPKHVVRCSSLFFTFYKNTFLLNYWANCNQPWQYSPLEYVVSHERPCRQTRPPWLKHYHEGKMQAVFKPFKIRRFFSAMFLVLLFDFLVTPMVMQSLF